MLELESPGSEFCFHISLFSLRVARGAISILFPHVLNTGQRAGLCAADDVE